MATKDTKWRRFIEAPRKAGQLWIYLGLIPALGIAIDQFLKWKVLDFFNKTYGVPVDLCARPNAPHTLHELPGLMDLNLSCNYGISWGMLGGANEFKRWGLAAFAIIVSILLAWLLVKTKDRLSSLSFALILAGSIGNVIDRVRYGAVVDFIDFSSLKFNFIFNPADVFITMGVIGMLAAVLLGADTQAGKPAQK
ncbi:signal peptidase II [Robiginitomaculum antarcticum]|uniref:signal peptidase II n=1 Tax=Robiginitomaculum antarcticum TaxID=437507 RepID=UPI00037CE33B|nr:signal peptidase II [Robiginitomaculum antarcticum]